MRKQTKLVAVLSAAALLAMGASMTSFAAGWEKDDAGIWHYYDSDDEMVTGEWKKDGGKWFYLDDDGEMQTDSWVDDEYYLSLIHISEPTRLLSISYAVFCLKK